MAPSVPRAPDAPSPPDLAPELCAALAARTDPDGFLPFDRFVEVALYAPGVGYYRRPRTPFGPTGDFYTAPRVDPLFGATVAARVAEVRSRLGASRRFRVIDLGGGDGTLLAGVVAALAERGAAEGIEAVAVDRSGPRRAAALEAVGRAANAAGVPVRATASLAEVGPVVGVVVANELLDAQPFRRLRWDGSVWQELGFRLDGDRLVPVEATLRGPVPPPALPALGPERSGTIVEVSAAAQAIVREVADHLVAGLFVLLDFGDDEVELLARHPRGTAAAVRGHRALDSPSALPGEADLSAFVNFRRVRDAARAAGLVEVGYRPQAEALGAWGFVPELERALARASTSEEEVRRRLAAKNLLFGFGTFRALELAPPAFAEALRPLSGAEPAAPR